MVGPCSETFSDSVALLNSSVATGTYRQSPGQGLRAAHEFRFEARLDKRRDTSSFRGGWDLTRNACQPSSSCARSGSSEAGALPQAISVASEGAARRSARDPAGAPRRSSPPGLPDLDPAQLPGLAPPPGAFGRVDALVECRAEALQDLDRGAVPVDPAARAWAQKARDEAPQVAARAPPGVTARASSSRCASCCHGVLQR